MEAGHFVRWKHCAKKKSNGGFSISLMLRTVSAHYEVDATTGHVVYDESELDPELMGEFQKFASGFDGSRFEERKAALLHQAELFFKNDKNHRGKDYCAKARGLKK